MTWVFTVSELTVHYHYKENHAGKGVALSTDTGVSRIVPA